jgi:hypothetical protein
VLSDSSTFLRFWLTDGSRETLISHLPKQDLAKLRLVCHDFSVRAAPSLFQDLSITFKTSTFTKPARLAALDRLGFHVETLKFTLPHTPETFLPPLVEPETGEELSFTYTPQIEPPSLRRPKYGDEGTTEILTKQYPPLFHAATNVSAFVRGFSAFNNLTHLKIACPGYDPSQRFRRSTVDFALISLRIAVERNCLNALDTLTLSPIHTSGILHLSPLLGYGATPGSARRWRRIKHLNIQCHTPLSRSSKSQLDGLRLLQTYLTNFQHNLESFDFRWQGEKGPLPFARPRSSSADTSQHPAHVTQRSPARKPLPQTFFFPKLSQINLENIATTSSDLSILVQTHKSTIEQLDLKHVELTHGTWEEAFAALDNEPQTPRPATGSGMAYADIPIMFSPSTASSPPRARAQQTQDAQAVSPTPPNHDLNTKATRPSRWLASSSSSKKRGVPGAARKVREGWAECEEGLRKVLRGSFGVWRQ